MIKKIIQAATMIGLLLVTQFCFSQSKPGCEPKSCGPGNTKVSEARVITDLRNDLQGVIIKMADSKHDFDTSIISLVLPKGSSDDESILFISSTIEVIKVELLNKLSEQEILADLKNHKPVPVLSKQEMMINLKKNMQILIEQVKGI